MMMNEVIRYQVPSTVDALADYWMALRNNVRIVRHGYAWNLDSVNVGAGSAVVTADRQYSAYDAVGIENRR